MDAEEDKGDAKGDAGAASAGSLFSPPSPPRFVGSARKREGKDDKTIVKRARAEQMVDRALAAGAAGGTEAVAGSITKDSGKKLTQADYQNIFG